VKNQEEEASQKKVSKKKLDKGANKLGAAQAAS